MSKKNGVNMSRDEVSFRDLRCKEVINEADGRKLGRVCDLVFSPRDGCVLGIVAPFNPKGLFFKGEQVYIPLKNILKIGPDVILVKLSPDLCRPDGVIDMHHEEKKEEKRHDHHDHHGHHDHDGRGRHDRYDRHDHHDKHDHGKEKDCDKRCEKCMLFDCERRWCF